MNTKQRQSLADEQRAMTLRVRRIVGQLQAVERMLAEERECGDILMQIVSSRKALKSLAEKLIHSHTRHCIEGAQSREEGKQKLSELLTVLERYVE